MQAEHLQRVQKLLAEQFAGISFTYDTDEEWVSILIDESQISLMKVLSFLQEQLKIYDVRLEEISTESVIKKIYENNENHEK